MDKKEFVAQVRKNEKGEFEIRIPDEIEKSEHLKEGDFVKVTLKRKDNKRQRRLVGALGGGGGALALGTMLSYLTLPQLWSWEMALSFETIGILLIIMAVYADLKSRGSLEKNTENLN